MCRGQRLAYSIILCVYLCIHLMCRPFRSTRDNRLESLSLFSLVVLSSSLASASISNESLQSTTDPLHVALLVFGGVTLAVLVIVLVQRPLKRVYSVCCERSEATKPHSSSGERQPQMQQPQSIPRAGEYQPPTLGGSSASATAAAAAPSPVPTGQ